MIKLLFIGLNSDLSGCNVCVLFGHTLESMIFLCVTRYYLQMSKVSKEKMKDDIDEFGDFYFVDIDVSDVRQVFPQCSTWSLVENISLFIDRNVGRLRRASEIVSKIGTWLKTSVNIGPINKLLQISLTWRRLCLYPVCNHCQDTTPKLAGIDRYRTFANPETNNRGALFLAAIWEHGC